MYINDVKYACATCIKGHRSSHCTHAERPLFEIKKKGRPVTQCSHCRDLRRNRQIHVKCVCMDRSQSEPSLIATPASNSGDIEHAGHCTCKRTKKKSQRRPTSAASPLAVDVATNTNMHGTPSPPASASPSIQEPVSWSWALIAPKQEADNSITKEKTSPALIQPLDNANDYSFVFHKSVEPKKKQRRRSSLARRSSPINGVCAHNLSRIPSSDSSVKSEPVIMSDNKSNPLNLYLASPQAISSDTMIQNQQLSTSTPQSSRPMFSSDNENEAVDSLEFSLDGLQDDLAMLVDDKQSEMYDNMQGKPDDVANIPISSTSSISGEFTDELANTLTFESAAELMAIFEDDISQQQKQQQQEQQQHFDSPSSNQSCCGSFAPSGACYADLSLPGDSVCITITPVTDQTQSQRAVSRIVTCRCGPTCGCPGCLVHAGSNWMIDPYAGVPSSSCSSDEEDHAMLEQGTTHSSLQWLDSTSYDSM